MGRQGPRLVPFLKNGLSNKKYRNLISKDPLCLVFSLVLPHKTKKLDPKDELIFKDWYAINGKRYIFGSKHYTDARQALMASLRKSDYVEKVHISDNRLTYRILNKDEVKEKKRLKKELKNIKKTASDSDDVSSGYGSGGESPRNDPGLISLNDNVIILDANETPQVFYFGETNNLHVQQSTCFGKFDEVPKPEPMDVGIPDEKSLANSDASILPESDFLLPLESNLKSADYFPENIEQQFHSLDFMEYPLENQKVNSSNVIEYLPAGNEDFLPFDGFSDVDMNSLENDAVSFDSNPALASEGSIDNQVSETKNMPELSTDDIPEDFWKLVDEVMADESCSSGTLKESNQELISAAVDICLPDKETEESEKIYLCKKCIHLGKTPILFCEPQFQTSITVNSCEIKIAIEETVMKEINGFKGIKESKFINDHLMVILEPNDD